MNAHAIEASRARRGFILGCMLLATLALILGNPLASLWLASTLADTSAPVAGPYAVAGFGVIAGTIVIVRLLGNLAQAYNQAVGHTAPPRRHDGSAWQSARHEDPGHRVLSGVLLVAFTIAGVAVGVWFFFLAGSSLPS